MIRWQSLLKESQLPIGDVSFLLLLYQSIGKRFEMTKEIWENVCVCGNNGVFLQN